MVEWEDGATEPKAVCLQQVREIGRKWARKTKRFTLLYIWLTSGSMKRVFLRPFLYIRLCGSSEMGWWTGWLWRSGAGRFFCAAFENTICKILPYNNYLVYLHHNWDWYGKGDTRTFTMQEPIWAQRLLFCEHISHLYRSEARRSRCDKELSITCRTVRKRHSMHEKGHYKAIYAYPLLKAPGRRRLT